MHCLEIFQALGGYPILFVRNIRDSRAILGSQAIKERSPLSGRF
jgi:hypothetical protein